MNKRTLLAGIILATATLAACGGSNVKAADKTTASETSAQETTIEEMVLSPDEVYVSARSDYDAGNYNEAIRTTTFLIDGGESRHESFMLRGLCYYELAKEDGTDGGVEQYEKAKADFEKAQSINPEAMVKKELDDTYSVLSDYYLDHDESDKAIECLKKQASLGLNGKADIRVKAIQNGGLYDDGEGNQYNEYGISLRENHYNENGDLAYYLMFEYDKKNKIKASLYTADGTLSSSFEDYRYDEKGRATRVPAYDSSILKFNQYEDESDFNEFDKPTKSATYLQLDNGDVMEIRHSVNEYDDNGNKVRTTNYYEDTDEIADYFYYEYDDDGNLVKTSYKKADDSLVYYMVSQYDDQGNLTARISYDPDGTETRRIEYNQ